MAKIKKITAISTGTLDIGADAVNIDVGYDSSGNIISGSESPASTKNLGAALSELGISTYVHTKTGTVHNFQGSGINGKVKMTANIAEGDTVTLNGTAATAYWGADAFEAMAEKDLVDKTFLFILDGSVINFKSGVGSNGGTVDLTDATATPVDVLIGKTYYAGDSTSLKMGMMTSYGLNPVAGGVFYASAEDRVALLVPDMSSGAEEAKSGYITHSLRAPTADILNVIPNHAPIRLTNRSGDSEHASEGAFTFGERQPTGLTKDTYLSIAPPINSKWNYSYQNSSINIPQTNLANAIGVSNLNSNLLQGTSFLGGTYGSILDRNTVGTNSMIGINSSYPSVGTIHAANTQYNTHKDNTVGLDLRVPVGYYNGGSYVYATNTEVASNISLTAAKIIKGNTILGIAGTGGEPGGIKGAGVCFNNSTSVVSGSYRHITVHNTRGAATKNSSTTWLVSLPAGTYAVVGSLSAEWWVSKKGSYEKSAALLAPKHINSDNTRWASQGSVFTLSATTEVCVTWASSTTPTVYPICFYRYA